MFVLHIMMNANNLIILFFSKFMIYNFVYESVLFYSCILFHLLVSSLLPSYVYNIFICLSCFFPLNLGVGPSIIFQDQLVHMDLPLCLLRIISVLKLRMVTIGVGLEIFCEKHFEMGRGGGGSLTNFLKYPLGGICCANPCVKRYTQL